MDVETKRMVVKVLSEKIMKNYIFPDIAEKISVILQDRLSNSEYDQALEKQSFADLLTQHIQEVNHDIHLAVEWGIEPLPEEDDSLINNQSWLEEQKQITLLDNYGLYKLERLPGNVGYLDIREFQNPVWGGETAVAAMKFLSNTSSLIFDLRNCRGGDPDMVALFSSYLLGDDPVHLNSIYDRDQNHHRQYWSLPYVPGGRFPNKPVYILTSRYTFSGGEEFTYNLKTLGRAIVIGETSGGGAHPGSFYRLHENFQVFIPTGRAVNPVTNSNWEGTGVVPDVSTLSDDAYKVGYRMALTFFIESYSSSDLVPYKQLVKEAQNALQMLAEK